ncbi:TetR family transcriptional regulator [Arthrobacter sp. zg-Y820]|uniref:TetR family transcriptional regulator n=1 Tax=unclassified Arthrobacter TaxID=235627 RepID=UPI001E353866|nr:MULTISPECIES: TetR family transcriptional regulator [unclassified Arthrobacter]MCC9196517.1 TetR family transcriptional regulator [Arthrobacter sp. zg-Y820]MDK1279379.1 TetR family transcriptional regulator [Arthrobacter sp. zg.Y820]WIB08237.1 TetR family transcriptional regulator [Arthrobacter sp. zg-Y820]
MRTDGEATRARILAAARTEFARYGLAGARVDRIAAEARASKERLYAYFGDKRSLFTAVLEVNMQETTERIPRDAHDLPGFVSAMFDHATENPDHLRMLDWARLENEPGLAPQTPCGRPGPTTEDIVSAQEQGIIDPGWDPDDLVVLLLSLATAWAQSPQSLFTGEPEEASGSPRRRDAAVAAACRILKPKPHAG